MLGCSVERDAVVIKLAKENEHSNTSTVYCVKIYNLDEEQTHVDGNPFPLPNRYNRGSLTYTWEDGSLREKGIEVGAVIAIEEQSGWHLRNTGKKMEVERVLSQKQSLSVDHGVVFHGKNCQTVCEQGIPLCSSSGQKEKPLTGVVLAISKHDRSSSIVFAREVDADCNGSGQPFQLKNDPNGYVWKNEHLTAENLTFGSLVKYRKHGGNVYCNKVDCRPQDVTKVQMDLDYSECVFPGIADGFPKAKIHKKGVSMDEMPEPCIAVIGMKSASIKNERIQFTSFHDEDVNLKLRCREHLQLSTSSIELQLRESNDSLQDSALVKFYETQHATRNPNYIAVCVGLLLRHKPTVISISEEPVHMKDGNGTWVKVPGEVLFDSGNQTSTAISNKLVDELDLKPDGRKFRRVIVVGGEDLQCSTVVIEVNVRGHKFKVNALVGATAPDTDLLIGKDIMSHLIKKKYSFGE